MLLTRRFVILLHIAVGLQAVKYLQAHARSETERWFSHLCFSNSPLSVTRTFGLKGCERQSPRGPSRDDCLDAHLVALLPTKGFVDMQSSPRSTKDRLQTAFFC